MGKIQLIILSCVLLAAAAPCGVLCQESAVAPVQTQPEELSVYGEVQASDTAAGTLSVQHYDYDTDEEKTMELVIDKDTKIENAATGADIKKGDWVDVTYVISGSKHLARSIFVEKEDEVMAGAEGVGMDDE